MVALAAVAEQHGIVLEGLTSIGRHETLESRIFAHMRLDLLRKH